MEFCKDCKYLRMDSHFGWCSLTERLNRSKNHTDSKASAYYDGTKFTVLFVDPDFGCVQFEDKILENHSTQV